MTVLETESLYKTYRLKFVVDELKPHLKPNSSDKCFVRRGKIIKVSPNGKEAEISCECGATVKESV